jgi:transposase
MRVSVGIDVAKELHWVTALDEGAGVLWDGPLETPQAIDALIAKLRELRGEVVIGIDVLGSIAPFLQACLLAEGFTIVYVPGVAVNRARQGFSGGEAKSDQRDARVIADQVRTRRDLRRISADDETTIAIRLLVGRRRDLLEEQNRVFIPSSKDEQIGPVAAQQVRLSD